MQDFTGKVAIVTGTTGIGKAIVKRLAQGSFCTGGEYLIGGGLKAGIGVK